MIRRIKSRYRDVAVVLGGTYVTLCCKHALEKSGADFVLQGEDEFTTLQLVNQLTRNQSDYSKVPIHIDDYPFPARDLIRKSDFAAVLTARGCSMTCSYCAVRLVSPGFRQRDPHQVVDELQWCHEAFGTRNFAFYDDALLLNVKDTFG